MLAAMEGEKHPAVYVMASRYRGTLYTGVTSALWSRICDHKNGTTLVEDEAGLQPSLR
jgi:predicted GIY-YIG superfamily endonuclease